MNRFLNLNFIFYSALLLVALLASIGAGVYRVYALDTAGITATISLTILAYFIILRFTEISKEKPDAAISLSENSGRTDVILRLVFLIVIAAEFFLLFQNQTSLPIISPWQAVPSYFFAGYMLAAIILFAMIARGRGRILPYVSLFYFLSLSVAVFVYELGYGFDPFIHRATEGLIADTGAVDPKPFYYLGQYSLVVIFHKLTVLSLNWLDKLLVPALAALFLPYYLFKLSARWFADKTAAYALLAVLPALPFSYLIVTTPQNLAYVFLLLALIIGLYCRKASDLVLIYALALAALATQAVAGIPALIFAVALTIFHSDGRVLKKILYPALFAASTIALPLAFYLFESSGSTAGGETAATGPLSLWTRFWSLAVPDRENMALNFIYLVDFNLPLIAAFLAAAGAYIAYRHRDKCRVTAVYAGLSLSMFLSYFLTALLPFGFLVSYERSDYADRILLLAVFFTLPFVLLSLYGFIHKLFAHPHRIKAAFAVFFSLLLAVSLYLSYPRFDHYHNSHLYAVSQTDVEAVRQVEENASGDYIVLANQQVSAAALSQYGFKKYFQAKDECRMPNAECGNGIAIRHSPFDIFYYPIPTGGPLYQYYLKMVYEKPSRETMRSAMDLAGVSEGYFILNKYWWAFPKIAAEAKLEADSWQEINNGDVYIFRYTRSDNPTN